MSAADFARTFQSKVRQGDKCVLLSRVCFKYQVSAGDHSIIPAWAAMKPVSLCPVLFTITSMNQNYLSYELLGVNIRAFLFH